MIGILTCVCVYIFTSHIQIARNASFIHKNAISKDICAFHNVLEGFCNNTDKSLTRLHCRVKPLSFCTSLTAIRLLNLVNATTI